MIDKRGQPVLSSYPQEGINASAGIISTVRDLARYDAAIDRHLLLRADTQETAWTNYVNGRGQALPYALGWFVQNYAGNRLIWHYGYWDTFSALILKVPERRVTLLLLANSDGLSAPFPSLGGAGDVTGSAFAMLFLRMLQEPGVLDPDSPAIASNGVVNAASMMPEIAPGAWATVLGQNFSNIAAPGRGWRAEEIVNGILPTSLEGVSVRIDGKPGAISFVGPGQINFQVPDGVSEGRVHIEVEGPSGVSESEAAVQPVAPALFTTRIQEKDVLLALHADGTLVARPVQIAGATPARPGETIVVYGTGFGPTIPPRPSGQIIEPAPLPAFVARIGGVEASSDFGGIVSPGVYQFNLRVPQGLSGDQTVAIEVGGAASQGGLKVAIE